MNQLFLFTILISSLSSLNTIPQGTGGDFVDTAKKSARDYIAAYNEEDPKVKEQLLSTSFSDDGKVFTPTRELDKNGLRDMVKDSHKEYEMEIVGNVDVHHKYLTFKWRYTETSSGESWSGTDYCELTDEGKLLKVVIFFDE